MKRPWFVSVEDTPGTPMPSLTKKYIFFENNQLYNKYKRKKFNNVIYLVEQTRHPRIMLPRSWP